MGVADEFKPTAVISNCGLYRYLLTRCWAKSEPRAVFIMLNPSTADETHDDPTIRRCISFAKREGCGGLIVVNLFAFRATTPSAMKAVADPIGPDNDKYIISACANALGPIICAWGNHGTFKNRDADVRHLIDRQLHCLKLNSSGQPGHPLYIKGNTPLIEL